jgi:hypothetical protein
MKQYPGYPGNTVFHGTPEFQEIDSEKHQGFTGGTHPFFQEGDNNMFRQELIGIKAPGLFLCVRGKNTLYPLC